MKKRTIAHLKRSIARYAAIGESYWKHFQIVESEYLATLKSDNLENRYFAAQRVKIALAKILSANEQLEALQEELHERQTQKS
jgi:hypothetical protein